MQGFDQPVGRLELLADIVLVVLVGDLRCHHGVIGLIDQHLGQGVGVQFNQPATARIGPDEDIRDHRLGGRHVEAGRRFRIKRAQIGDHVAEVFLIDAADLAQLGKLTGREQVEIVEQGLHRRIKPVAINQLQTQALGQVAGEDAGRIEPLQLHQHRIDHIRAAAELFAQLTEIRLDIAGAVEAVEQGKGDDPLGGIGDLERYLCCQMLTQIRRTAVARLQFQLVIAQMAAATTSAEA